MFEEMFKITTGMSAKIGKSMYSIFQNLQTTTASLCSRTTASATWPSWRCCWPRRSSCCGDGAAQRVALRQREGEANGGGLSDAAHLRREHPPDATVHAELVGLLG